jgi:hypothetical protein
LARLYAESKAGRTGAGQRDFLVDLKKLLADAGCQDGDDRSTAIRGEICGLAACTRQIWRIEKYTLLAIYGDFLDFLTIIRHN